MKTKIAFVIGGVLGYVLGARAGRKRYEQIKSGALKVWNSGPVKTGVGSAQDYAQEKVGLLLAGAFEAGRNYFATTQKHKAPSATEDATTGGDE